MSGLYGNERYRPVLYCCHTLQQTFGHIMEKELNTEFSLFFKLQSKFGGKVKDKKFGCEPSLCREFNLDLEKFDEKLFDTLFIQFDCR